MEAKNFVEAIDVNLEVVGKTKQIACFFQMSAELMQDIERACELVQREEVTMLPFFRAIPHQIIRTGHSDPQAEGAQPVHVQLDSDITRCKVKVWCDHGVSIELIPDTGKERISCYMGSVEELKAIAKFYAI